MKLTGPQRELATATLRDAQTDAQACLDDATANNGDVAGYTRLVEALGEVLVEIEDRAQVYVP